LGKLYSVIDLAQWKHDTDAWNFDLSIQSLGFAQLPNSCRTPFIHFHMRRLLRYQHICSQRCDLSIAIRLKTPVISLGALGKDLEKSNGIDHCLGLRIFAIVFKPTAEYARVWIGTQTCRLSSYSHVGFVRRARFALQSLPQFSTNVRTNQTVDDSSFRHRENFTLIVFTPALGPMFQVVILLRRISLNRLRQTHALTLLPDHHRGNLLLSYFRRRFHPRTPATSDQKSSPHSAPWR